VTSYYTREQMLAYGWRVPLIIGCIIIPFIFAIRRSLVETDEFLARKHRPRPSEVFRSLRENWRVVILGTMMATMTTVSFYFITAYTPTFGTVVLGLDAKSNMIVILCVGLTNFTLLPVMGALSDRIGRRPLLITCSLLAAVTAYPALAWLVAEPSFTRLLLVELWLAVVYAGYNGAMIVYLTEIVPAHVRTAGFSLAYSLATALFGGFTPAICTYLIQATGNRAVPAVWLGCSALVGLTATLLLGARERAGKAEPLTEPVTVIEPVKVNLPEWSRSDAR